MHFLHRKIVTPLKYIWLLLDAFKQGKTKRFSNTLVAAARLHKSIRSPMKAFLLNKTFFHFPPHSTSRGLAPYVAFLQTPALVVGVPIEVEGGAGANRFLQDPAITKVSEHSLVCRLELCALVSKLTKQSFLSFTLKANYSYESSSGAGYRKYSVCAD